MVYRCYRGPKTEEANGAATEACRYLQSTVKARTASEKRGDFDLYYFMFHRENLTVSATVLRLCNCTEFHSAVC